MEHRKRSDIFSLSEIPIFLFLRVESLVCLWRTVREPFRIGGYSVFRYTWAIYCRRKLSAQVERSQYSSRNMKLMAKRKELQGYELMPFEKIVELATSPNNETQL